MTDVFHVPVRDGRIALRVFRAVDSDTAFDGDVPALREHPRIAVADTRAAGPAVIAACAAADEVIRIGELHADEMADERLVEPITRAELHGPERQAQSGGAYRVPVPRRLDAPTVGDGGFGPEVQRAGTCREGIGPHGEELRRSFMGHDPERCKQQRRQDDSFSFHGLIILRCTARHSRGFGTRPDSPGSRFPE